MTKLEEKKTHTHKPTGLQVENCFKLARTEDFAQEIQSTGTNGDERNHCSDLQEHLKDCEDSGSAENGKRYLFLNGESQEIRELKSNLCRFE